MRPNFRDEPEQLVQNLHIVADQSVLWNKQSVNFWRPDKSVTENLSLILNENTQYCFAMEFP